MRAGEFVLAAVAVGLVLASGCGESSGGAGDAGSSASGPAGSSGADSGADAGTPDANAGSSGVGGSAGGGGAPAGCEAHLLYLNRDGGRYTRGLDDSSANVSSIVEDGKGDVAAFSGTGDEWAALVACVRRAFDAYDVAVVETDPGAAEHVEVVVSGGDASQVIDQPGQTAYIGSIAPSACMPIRDAIAFVFTLGGVGDAGAVQPTCETVAAAAANVYGLEWVLEPCDIVTYLSGCASERTFTDVDAPCGTSSPASCSCGATTQNSHQELLAALGPRCGGG